MHNSVSFQDLSLWVKFKAPLVGEIRFNPIVTFFAVLVIWGFVVWGCVEGRHGRCFLDGVSHTLLLVTASAVDIVNDICGLK